MTMHPDNRVYPPPRHMEKLWSDAEQERIASHISAASIYSALHEDGDRDGMGAAAWACATLWIATLGLFLGWVFFF
jgi:hypothetical protein